MSQSDGTLAAFGVECEPGEDRPRPDPDGDDRRAVAARLDEFGVDSEAVYEDPEVLAGVLPHELGLTPLGCGNCGAREIVEHPCRNCGFDPREGGE